MAVFQKEAGGGLKVFGMQIPGFYTAYWDGKADSSQRVAAGVYFYRLETKNFKSTKKVVPVR
jgi:hypothetical protein